MSTTLTFLGAAGTVTGSKTLLDDGTHRVLVDAGLFQGVRELRRRNWEPLDLHPASLDAVVLTHAHLDHSGYLPALAREGLTCPVYATRSTAALVELVLRDSAKLQEEDARYAAGAGFSKHSPPRPLYDSADVEHVLPLLTPVEFGERVPMADGVHLTLEPAGHILGSSSALVELGGLRLVFSGDLGRRHHPLLVPPTPPARADVIVVESTYGDRVHDTGADDALADVVRRTIGRGGVVLIPAFAVDRTEVLLMALKRLTEAGLIPRVPVFADSPMALGGLAVYRQAVADGAADVRPGIVGDRATFDPGDLREARSPAQSSAINAPAFPCIIVSASGMATGGRVVHHLKSLLPNARNAVVLVGFQAPGTRGRDLVEGVRTLRMHGQDVPVRAEVVSVEGLSVHADSDELLAWVGAAPVPPRVVYVVHGEPAAAARLAQRIGVELGWPAEVARDGEVVHLDP